MSLLLVAVALAVATRRSDGGVKLPGPTDPHFMIIAAEGCTGSSWLWRVFGDMVRWLQPHVGEIVEFNVSCSNKQTNPTRY
jgi:hypothetical protein